MATARFKAKFILDVCEKAIRQNDEHKMKARECAINRLIDNPKTVGIWPFQRPHYRTQKEAEDDYRSCVGLFGSEMHYVEGGFNRKINRLSKILSVAKAAYGFGWCGVHDSDRSNGYVTLNDDEVRELGIHIKDDQ